tara:strand:- start:2934 stop:3716 length:783 start_codon:yes stop_codon:yes gene_type:complete
MKFLTSTGTGKAMIKTGSSNFILALTILVAGLSGLPLNAQQSEDFQPKNVISANVIGLLTNTFNAEFERVISLTSTIGFGGSTASTTWYPAMDDPPPEPPIIGTDQFGGPIYDPNDPAWLQAMNDWEMLSNTLEEARYVNFDVFYRFYPGSRRTRTYKAPIGWAFGMKMGLTAVNGAGRGDGAYFGFGFDMNHSWVLGPDDNFYVGLGFGLKRLMGVPQVTDSDYAGYGGEKHSALDGKLPFGGGDLYPTIRIINIGFIF